jgi:tRNA(Ile)-lysidine synthase
VDFRTAVLATVDREDLAPSGATLLCGLSGGPDSVALLAVLAAAAPARGWRVLAAHLDHALRPDSGRDAAFCEELCRSLGVPLHRERLDWGTDGPPVRGREAAARDRRYAYLLETARQKDAIPAVGHHADDRAETFLAQLIRGAGPRGLSLPRYRREDGVIRPLLDRTRTEVLGFLQEEGLPYRTDPTNEDGSHLRSRLRTEILPRLARENPEIARSLARTGRMLGGVDDLLQMLAGEAAQVLSVPGRPGEFVWGEFPLDGPIPPTYHPVVLSTLLRNHVRQLGGEVEFEPLDRCVRAWVQGSRFDVDLPGRVRISVDRGRASVYRSDLRRSAVPLAEREVPVPGRVVWCEDEPAGGQGSVLLDAVVTSPPEDPDLLSGPRGAWVDADCVTGRLVVRTRRNGDRYRPLGLRGTVKVQDLFVDRKIPREARGRVPIVADDRGVLWIPGFRVDHRGRITEGTKKALWLEFGGPLPHLEGMT